METDSTIYTIGVAIVGALCSVVSALFWLLRKAEKEASAVVLAQYQARLDAAETRWTEQAQAHATLVTSLEDQIQRREAQIDRLVLTLGEVNDQRRTEALSMMATMQNLARSLDTLTSKIDGVSHDRGRDI